MVGRERLVIGTASTTDHALLRDHERNDYDPQALRRASADQSEDRNSRGVYANSTQCGPVVNWPASKYCLPVVF